jgi:hypothetical protein
MKTTEYLYNVQASDFMNLKYIDAIVFKIKAGKKLRHHLVYDFHYTKRDEERFNAVHNAIKFNENLLLEMGKTYKDYE